MVSPFTNSDFFRLPMSNGAVPQVRRASGMRCANRSWLIKPLVLSAVLLGLVSGAKAADPVNYDEPVYDPISESPSLWAGSYVGLQTGFSQTGTTVKPGGSKKDVSRVDAAFGLFGGYNWEVSRFVLGVEGSVNYLGGYKKAQHPTLGSIKTGSRWAVDAKLRAGLPFNNVMPYLSLGVAMTEHSLKANGKTNSSIGLNPVFGGGLEVAVTDKWRVRADYSLSGVANGKDWYNGTRVKREAANHRLMIGVSRSF